MEYDFDFVCNGIAEMTRIPIRVYQGSAFLSFYSPISFTTDPAKPYIDSLLESDRPVKYFITPLSQYYGIVHIEDYSIIIGPSSELKLSPQNMNALIHLLDIPDAESAAFTASINAVTRLPISMFLQILTLNYYFFTREKIDVSDLMLKSTLEKSEDQQISLKTAEIDADQKPDTHTTMEFERAMLECIRKGNVKKLTDLFSNASVGLPGTIGITYLSHMKNLFITTATLVSRAAIEGGLPAEEALQLSDYYITHCDRLTKAEFIMNLQYNMIMDFTNRVYSLCQGNSYSKPIRTAITYIHDHLNENPSIEDICDATSMSRSQLSTRFKSETGCTITEFIRNHKIDVAKDLLQKSDMSLLEISVALGFSSQSHFQKAFREVEHITPKKYRETIK